MRGAAKVGLILLVVVAVWSAGPAADAQDKPRPVTKLFEETSYSLKDVTFVDASLGWAVGAAHWDQAQRRYNGTIIHTTDGGMTWQPQSVDTTALLNAVVFVDTATGWAAGADGMILHTVDGGQTWSRQAVGTTDAFNDIVFVDALTGWAVATVATTYDDFLDVYTDWNATIWHTIDGGETWQPQKLPEAASILQGVECVDALNGWAVGTARSGEDQYGRLQHAGVIYHTADGGQTWTEQIGVESFSFAKVDFVDALHGWAVGFATSTGADQRAVFHTSDGGQTWERQEPGGSFSPLWDVQFIDQNRGYIVGANYVGAWGPPVFRTFDGGATWENVKMRDANPLSVEGLTGVAVMGDRVFAVGDHDFVAVSDQAWAVPASETECLHLQCLFEQRYLNPHYIFHDVHFNPDGRGWVVGSRTFGVAHWGQVILHSPDSGLTWTTVYEHAPTGTLFSVHRLDDIVFLQGGAGWAVGSSERVSSEGGRGFEGGISMTGEGGQTWQRSASAITVEQDLEFFAVDFVDDLNGWALAANYPQRIHLAHTTDGGADWQWVDTGVEKPLRIGFALVLGDVDFTDAQNGWAAGGLGTVIHTADGGSTWAQQTLTCDWPECPLRLFAVEMTDPSTGWIGGEGVFHTTDGGANWLQQAIDLPGDVYAMQFLDAQHGWMTGDRGMLMRTVDGGMSWMPAATGEGAALNGLHFITPERGWIVGDYGVILGYSIDAPAS
ncbi:MAG: hypothetical protein JXN59_12250 [Anaerolineae bacterium]|nr:hypothetical protein [Anaerolineae bacterium]